MKQLIFLWFCLLAFSIHAQQVVPETYVAHKTTTPIKIDGLANEDDWQKAPWSSDFIDIEGVKTPEYQTNVKMLWDDEYLYFYAKMEEPQVWATLKQRDTVIFYNNDFEIFIDPTGDTHNYMEFEVNALNTVWDLFLLKPYRENAPVIDNWDIKGLKSAVNINGTINNSKDVDKGWSVEIAMPWKALEEANTKPGVPENDFWRINFSRVNWDYQLKNGRYTRKKDADGKFLPEYNWVWSPQGVINMHEPEHWGYVYFSNKPANKPEEFTVPKDEHIKWLLYRLYRKQKTYFQEHQKWADSMAKLGTFDTKIAGKKIQPQLENHQTGWNISVKSPFTNKTLIIREDGKFIEP